MAKTLRVEAHARPIEDEDLLISVAGGLGRYDEENSVYRKDQDCLECLKDLQRFLRRDDTFDRPVFHRIGQWDLVSTDVVPLIVQYQEDHEIVYNALKILTFLTMPVDPTSDLLQLQCKYLLRIKECFLANDALAVIVGLLSRPLERYPRLSERDILVVQLVLTFIRNLLCIDSAMRDLGIESEHEGQASSANKDDLLQRLFNDNVLELVLLVAQHCSDKTFRRDAPLILHIIHQVFDGFSSQQLFQRSEPPLHARRDLSVKRNLLRETNFNRNRNNHREMKGDLHNVLLSEKRTRGISSRNPLPTRHRLFSGTFVKKYADVSQKVVFTQRSAKPSAERDEQMYRSAGRRGKKAPEKKLYAMSSRLRDLLKSFTESFLLGGYDILMDSIRPELMHGIGISKLEKDDYIRFFELGCFCTSYMKFRMEKIGADELHRKYEAAGKSPFSEISSTMGWDMFHLLLTVWQQQIEIPSRAEEKDWDLQASSLSLLKEMMYVLDLAYRIGTKADRKAADKLQRKLLHDDLRQSGLFPLLCRMIKNYNPRIQPKDQAGDMMEALYIIIRTFERLDSTERGGFIVRQRASKRRSQQKKTIDAPASASEEATPAEEDKPEEDKPEETVGRDGNGEGKVDEAEKEAAPSQEGDPKKPEAEEEAEVKEHKKGQDVDGKVAEAAEEIPATGQEKSMSKDPLEQLENESETDSDAQLAMKESTFDLNHRLSQELTAPLLIQTLASVLETYKTNSTQLNNSIVGILKRVVLPDCLNLMPCVWHLSFLMVVEKILSDSAIKKNPSFASMLQLCNYITRKLMDRLLPELTDDLDSFQKSAKESLARITFVDLLFWKNRRDAEMLRDEYGWHNKYAHREAIRKALADEDEACGAGILKSIDKLAPSSTKAFTSEDEEELTDAYNKFKDKEDLNVVIDCIVEEMHFRFKPRQLKKELRNLGLIAKTAPKKAKSKLSEEEKETLVRLWNKHKDDENRMKAIAEGFDLKYTTRKLTGELRLLGLLEKKKPAAKITEQQIAQVKEAFHKHKSSATYLHDIENEVAGQGLSKAQIQRLLKKFGLERKKITRLADSSDESSSDSDADAESDQDRVTTDQAAKTSSPWEMAQSSGSGSDSQSSDEEDDSSDSSGSDRDDSSNSSSSSGSEGESAEEKVDDGEGKTSSLAIEMDEEPVEQQQQAMPIRPEEGEAMEEQTKVERGKNKNNTKKKKRKISAFSSAPQTTKSKSQKPKKRRLLKKAPASTANTVGTKANSMFEDDDLDDEVEALDQSTPVVEKKQSQNFLLDSDSE